MTTTTAAPPRPPPSRPLSRPISCHLSCAAAPLQHAHALVFNPASPTDCYVPDLGLDVVHHYKYADGKLSLQPATSLTADGVAMGPRHMCFHPSGQFAYFNNEMAAAVTPVRVDLETGGLSIAGDHRAAATCTS